MTDSVAKFIRTIPDFPHKGIMFRDVTTLFGNPEGLRLTIAQMVAAADGLKIDKVAGLEARGFILGGAIAQQLGVGFIPVRKKGKLPWKRISQDYELEYGTETVEIHQDAAQPGDKILLIDDLIATGGTAAAGINLLERLGAEVVHCAFVVDLPALGGMKRIESLGIPATALCAFDGE